MQWKISVKKNDRSKAVFATCKELLAFSSVFWSCRCKLCLGWWVFLHSIQLYVYALLRASTHFGFGSFAGLLHNWDTQHTEANKYVDPIYGQWLSNLCSPAVGTLISALLKSSRKYALGYVEKCFMKAECTTQYGKS